MGDILKEKILNKKARICVVGLGYVGMPLAVETAKAGFSVIGVDKNINRVQEFNNGEDYISCTDEEEFKELIKSGRLKAVNNFSIVKDMDVIIICVPTALSKNLVPDLQHIQNATREIADNLRRDQLICVESTIYPGTTEEIILPVLEASGLKVEKDFYLCHSPERIDPGNQSYTTKNINKIVGGVGPESLARGEIFYKQIIEQVISVSGAKVAELAKVHENTFRAVNIALVNELALLCDKMSINVWEVLDAAFTKPFGIMPFYPGPGVGGHCIPVDPHYLEWKAREYNFITRFIGIAGDINRRMPEFVREKVLRALNEMGIAPSRSRILILGMAYKKDTGDYRETPVIPIVELLLSDGADIIYHDPYVNEIEIASKLFKSAALSEETVQQADVVLITTEHSGIDYHWLVKRAQKIIDARNATKGIPGREEKVILI
ncbi:MAG: nucleotide sugar dehydrogenase [Peptococcaceae bacterium]